jgi:hypothetical protein
MTVLAHSIDQKLEGMARRLGIEKDNSMSASVSGRVLSQQLHIQER